MVQDLETAQRGIVRETPAAAAFDRPQHFRLPQLIAGAPCDEPFFSIDELNGG
jgi:hypothetical protein